MGASDGGFYQPGEYAFPGNEGVHIACIHPYYWPGDDVRPQKDGVGVKLTLWPAWSEQDNTPFPYDQTTCNEPNHPVVAGMQQEYGVDCASGDDGIYCIEPDSWGANDEFLGRLDFAGSTVADNPV